jgi:hypothetical protein
MAADDHSGQEWDGIRNKEDHEVDQVGGRVDAE